MVKLTLSENFEQIEKYCFVFSSQTRLKILREICINRVQFHTDLAEKVGIRPENVAKHTHKLELLGLIRAELESNTRGTRKKWFPAEEEVTFIIS